MIRSTLALLVVIACPIFGSACVELVAELPEGPARAVDFEGDLAVFGAGLVLKVVDLSVPSQPMELGRVVLPEAIRAVELVGDHAYVVSEQIGLTIVDLTDSAAPMVVSSIVSEIPGVRVEAADVKVVEPYAFLAEKVMEGPIFGRLHVIDISQPNHPVTVSVAEEMGGATSVATEGDLVFLGESRGVRVYDVSNPEQPLQLARMSGLWSTEVTDVEVMGSSVFILYEYAAEVVVFDITSPESPKEVSRLHFDSGYLSGLSVFNDLAVVATWWEGLKTIDISDPKHPEFAGSLDFPGTGVTVALQGELAIVAADAGGFRMMDVGIPNQPTEIGTFSAAGSSDSITMFGNLAIVSPRLTGAPRIIDVSNPSIPIEVSRLPMDAVVAGVALEGPFLYVSLYEEDRGRGIGVFDVSEPASPVEIDFIPLFLWPKGLAVQWPFIYVVGHSAGLGEGLWVIDIGNPRVPLVVGELVLGPNHPYSITVDGDLAFVGKSACPWAWPGCFPSLQVVDISDPRNPAARGFSRAGPYSKLEARGGLVYGSSAWGMTITDCRDPMVPDPVFWTRWDRGGHSVAIDRNTAVVTTVRHSSDPAPDAIDVYDLENPTWPRRVTSYQMPGRGGDVGMFGDRVLVAGGDEGISVYDVSTCGIPTPRRSSGRAEP